MKLLSGLVLSFALIFSTINYAQAEIPDALNVVCWDQTASSLAVLNAWKVRVTYNNLAPVIIQHTCTGATSPFTCKLNTPIPMNLQTGTLTVKLEAAAVNPDATLTAYSLLVTGPLSFMTPAPVPPTNSGSNLRIAR